MQPIHFTWNNAMCWMVSPYATRLPGSVVPMCSTTAPSYLIWEDSPGGVACHQSTPEKKLLYNSYSSGNMVAAASYPAAPIISACQPPLKTVAITQPHSSTNSYANLTSIQSNQT